MRNGNEKIPNPKELEKEIGEFLSKKFGDNVKIISPVVMSPQTAVEPVDGASRRVRQIKFDLKPEELIAYLDQYVVKQESAKAILATKICTHFNRIKRSLVATDDAPPMVGRIKNNVLMIGPTGVGKTYIIKLIAQKIGVPFVKGDATKFSETGYVGGDVEDLVRDLVREADDDIELAQFGIVYIDEIDKIASSQNLVGPDVSRTGVQRALLKPMEETEVDLKVPHDPISMIQEIERFRKTGKREKRSVNTANILFIVSGAFTDLAPIIQKRLSKQGIGFGAHISSTRDQTDILKQVRSEDLISYGFESEFVGRLPVRTVFENLTEADLYEILRSPNNPIILGKKFDFAAYDIDIKFDDDILRVLANQAFDENTGARGLVSAVEKALLEFEKHLPSISVRRFPATSAVINDPAAAMARLTSADMQPDLRKTFDRLAEEERGHISDYLQANRKLLSERYNLTLSASRIDVIAKYYTKKIMDVGQAVQQIKSFYDDIKKIELYFYKNHDINIVLEENAVDFMIEQLVESAIEMKDIYGKLAADFEYGLKLVRDKTGRNRFFITRQALVSPEKFVAKLLKNQSPTN